MRSEAEVRIFFVVLFFRFFSVFFFLVDPLEPLRVLHGHEEFLSQVFEWFVSRQIQAVKTGKEKNVGLIFLNEWTQLLDQLCA